MRPFHQTLGRQNLNQINFTILNSVLAKLVSHLTLICSQCPLWIKPGHNYPIPYLLATWPCQAEPHLVVQLGRRGSRPPPLSRHVKDLASTSPPPTIPSRSQAKPWTTEEKLRPVPPDHADAARRACTAPACTSHHSTPARAHRSAST